MGLDGVELVMALEEAFGLELTSDEVVKAMTPRLIGDAIFSKLQSTNQKTCQSQRAFYILRKTFMRKFGLRRAEVTPDMLFRSLVAQEQEALIWNDLKSSVKARSWPSLALPPWLHTLMKTSTCAVFIAVFFLFWNLVPVGLKNAVILGVLAMIAFNIIGARATRRFKTRIPSRYQRIRDIVPFAVTSDEIKWTREQVSAVVKQIVQEQLGISDEKYWEDAHFVNDFGMGQ